MTRNSVVAHYGSTTGVNLKQGKKVKEKFSGYVGKRLGLQTAKLKKFDGLDQAF